MKLRNGLLLAKLANRHLEFEACSCCTNIFPWNGRPSGKSVAWLTSKFKTLRPVSDLHARQWQCWRNKFQPSSPDRTGNSKPEKIFSVLELGGTWDGWWFSMMSLWSIKRTSMLKGKTCFDTRIDKQIDREGRHDIVVVLLVSLRLRSRTSIEIFSIKLLEICSTWHRNECNDTKPSTICAVCSTTCGFGNGKHSAGRKLRSGFESIFQF